MPLQQFDERVVDIGRWNIASTDPVNVWQQFRFGYEPDTRWDVLSWVNSDSIAHIVSIAPIGGSDDNSFGDYTVPARAGFDGNPPFDFLNALFPAANHYLQLPNGQSWYLVCREAISAGDAVRLFWSGGAL